MNKASGLKIGFYLNLRPTLNKRFTHLCTVEFLGNAFPAHLCLIKPRLKYHFIFCFSISKKAECVKMEPNDEEKVAIDDN